MKFFLTSEVDVYSDRGWTQAGIPMVLPLENFFASREYGLDVNLFRPSMRILPDDFLNQFNAREGKSMYSKKNCSLSVIRVLNYDQFIHSSPGDQQKIIVQEMLVSVHETDSIKNRLKDFDREKLYTDLKDFIHQQGWFV